MTPDVQADIKVVDGETLRRWFEEDARKAVRCLECNHRADPPYGDGKRCMSCASRPTAETMNMILR